MMHWITAVLAVALLGLFFGIIAGFVVEPDLIAVLVITFLMAGYDFYRDLRSRADKNDR
jgi:hypothetical protein